MGNNRLHAFRLTKYAYLAIDASNKDSVHLLIVPPGAPKSREDAAEQTAVLLLRSLAETTGGRESPVEVEDSIADSYAIDASMLDVLHSLCDLSAKVGYRYQRVRALSMQAELPLGVG